MELARYYNILAVRHQPFEDDSTPVSQTRDVGCKSLISSTPKANTFCRNEFFLSNELKIKI